MIKTWMEGGEGSVIRIMPLGAVVTGNDQASSLSTMEDKVDRLTVDNIAVACFRLMV